MYGWRDQLQRPRFGPWWRNHDWTVFSFCITALVKMWHWRSHVDIGLANLLKSPVLFGMFLQKNGSLGWLGHQGFTILFVVNSVCYSFVTVSCVAYGEDCRLKFCDGMCSEVWRGKRWRRCQSKPMDRR